MNNCLVTKLNVVVDNKNLRRFGEIYYTASEAVTNQVLALNKYQGSNATLYIYNSNGELKQEVSIPVLSGGTAAVNVAVGDIIRLTDKYNIHKLQLPGYFDIEEISYNDNLVTISGVKGKISSFANVISNNFNTLTLIDFNNCGEDLVDLVAILNILGKTEGELGVSYYRPKVGIKLNNVTIHSYTWSGSNKFGWINDKIYFILASVKEIYCVGYSNSEIDEMKKGEWAEYDVIKCD